MKLPLLCLTLGLGAALAAPIDMPIPNQTGTFTGNVRGYWFTAPVDFTIVGLFIPTTASTESMNIEVLRFNAVPPLFSGSTNEFVSLFRTINNPSADFIPVNIPVAAGDIIGILGQRGSVNSYAAGPTVTQIFGQDVTLQRLGMQLPLASNLAQDLWTESAGSISRVQIRYDVANLNEVPEPSTFALVAGAGLLLLLRRRG